MKKNIAFIIFLIISRFVLGQDRTLDKADSAMSILKSNIYGKIIDDITTPMKNDSLRIYIYVNTRAAHIGFSLGPAGGRPSFSHAVGMDKLAADFLGKDLKERFGKTKFELSDQESFNRELIIETSQFLNPLDAKVKRQERLYIEIGRPLFGWESLSILYRTQPHPQIRKEYHRKYYSDTSYIPAYFFYQDKNGDKSKKSLLYAFHIIIRSPNNVEAILVKKSTL